MKKIRLNILHRYVGICIAPFIVLQALSGLLLNFGMFRKGSAATVGQHGPAASSIWDLLLIKVHFGSGLLNDAYHLLLGAGIIWMAVTGWILYLRIRRMLRKQPATEKKPVPG